MVLAQTRIYVAETVSKERIQWIDNEKGFILIGVCLAHIGFTWNVFPYIPTFHMAAFFFLSGMLFNPNREWGEFVRAKCKNLLIPYVVLSVFFMFISPSLYQYEAHSIGSAWQNQIASVLTDNQYLHSLFVQILICLTDIINGYSAPYVGALWFVYTLFQLNILWFFPVLWISKSKYSSYILGLVALSCFILGWWLYMKELHIPFKIDIAITSSAFFVGGYLLKKIIPWVSKFSYQKLLLLFLLTGVYYYGVSHVCGGFIGYNTNNLDKDLLAYICVSWGGTLLLTLLFMMLSKINRSFYVGRSLRYISLNGIAFLAIHEYVKYLMKWMANYFQMQVLANNWLILFAIGVVCAISFPLINKYLYFLVGKKKPQQA